MTNLAKYRETFVKALRLAPGDVETARFKETRQWDSVGHLTLLSEIEEAFGVPFDPDDLMDLTSYGAGLRILAKYGIDLSP